MNVWFTADLHLGHANIIRYCLRPFMSPEEEDTAIQNPHGRWQVSKETVNKHDDALIRAINGMVQPNDILWILGDFCWGGFDVAKRYRERIRCQHVNLVLGNHDHRSIRPLFAEAIEQGMIAVDGQDIWLNHYPMRSWHKSFRGSWHLYGHVHGRTTAEDEANPNWLTKDVGVDACNYQPIGFAQLTTYMAPRQEAFQRMKLLTSTDAHPSTMDE